MGREDYIASIVNVHCIHYEAKVPEREQRIVQATRLKIRSWWMRFTIVRVMQVMEIQVIVMRVVARIVILFGFRIWVAKLWHKIIYIIQFVYFFICFVMRDESFFMNIFIVQ